jgi:hypothetical protein
MSLLRMFAAYSTLETTHVELARRSEQWRTSSAVDILTLAELEGDHQETSFLEAVQNAWDADANPVQHGCASIAPRLSNTLTRPAPTFANGVLMLATRAAHGLLQRHARALCGITILPADRRMLHDISAKSSVRSR